MYPRRFFHSSVSFATSRPPNPVAEPDVGSRRPVSIRIVVDLPEPFGPRKPKTFPRGISNDTRSTAVKSPKRRVRFSQRRRMSDEDEREEKEEDFLEGEESGSEGGIGRAGWLLMRADSSPFSLTSTNASSSVGATRRMLSAGTSPASASLTLPSKKSPGLPGSPV